MVLKVSPCYIYIMYITVFRRTDFEHPIFSIISSQGCFIDFIVEKRKNVEYSKLVNNPFKVEITFIDVIVKW